MNISYKIEKKTYGSGRFIFIPYVMFKSHPESDKWTPLGWSGCGVDTFAEAADMIQKHKDQQEVKTDIVFIE